MMALRIDMERKIKDAYEKHSESAIKDLWIQVAATSIIAEARYKGSERYQEKVERQNNRNA